MAFLSFDLGFREIENAGHRQRKAAANEIEIKGDASRICVRCMFDKSLGPMRSQLMKPLPDALFLQILINRKCMRAPRKKKKSDAPHTRVGQAPDFDWTLIWLC